MLSLSSVGVQPSLTPCAHLLYFMLDPCQLPDNFFGVNAGHFAHMQGWGTLFETQKMRCRLSFSLSVVSGCTIGDTVAALIWQHLVIGLAHVTCCISEPSPRRVSLSSCRQKSTALLAIPSGMVDLHTFMSLVSHLRQPHQRPCFQK